MGRKPTHEFNDDDLLEAVDETAPDGLSIPSLLERFGVSSKQPRRKQWWEMFRYALNKLVERGYLIKETDERGNVQYFRRT